MDHDNDVEGLDRGSVFPGFAGPMVSESSALMDQLVQHRLSSGFTQTEVAARMGTSQSTVARLEAGSGDMRLSSLRRYANAVGAEVAFGLRESERGDET